VQGQICFATPLLHTLCERESHRDTDDPEKEGENPIREGPPIPPGMSEHGINIAPTAWVVYENHGRDCEAAEGVEGG